MADTMRSLAELATLLADNNNSAISPQDLRDMLASLTPPHGSLYNSTPIETVIAVQGTYVKLDGTTTANNVRDFTHTNGRLQYTGRADQHFHIASHIDFITANNNQVVAFQLAKNGSPIAGSKVQRKTGTGADVGAISLHWDLDLAQNDYIELWVTNDTSATNITAQQFYLFALGMVM